MDTKGILETINGMPIWQQMGIEISGMELDYVQFKRGNLVVILPAIEILILGADKIRRMFAQLDS